jgi:hypothetical protein
VGLVTTRRHSPEAPTNSSESTHQLIREYPPRRQKVPTTSPESTHHVAAKLATNTATLATNAARYRANTAKYRANSAKYRANSAKYRANVRDHSQSCQRAATNWPKGGETRSAVRSASLIYPKVRYASDASFDPRKDATDVEVLRRVEQTHELWAAATHTDSVIGVADGGTG